VVAGAALIPFEIWKIAHPSSRTWLLVLALLVNVTVIAYLVTHLRQRIRQRRGSPSLSRSATRPLS
jgi:uncharacterized membrane protein (DUF2068 family)